MINYLRMAIMFCRQVQDICSADRREEMRLYEIGEAIIASGREPVTEDERTAVAVFWARGPM